MTRTHERVLQVGLSLKVASHDRNFPRSLSETSFAFSWERPHVAAHVLGERARCELHAVT